MEHGRLTIVTVTKTGETIFSIQGLKDCEPFVDSESFERGLGCEPLVDSESFENGLGCEPLVDSESLGKGLGAVPE